LLTRRSSPTWVNGHMTSAKTSIMVVSRSSPGLNPPGAYG
jgi:hypothetical protein